MKKIKRIILCFIISLISISIGSIGTFFYVKKYQSYNSEFEKLRTFLKENWYSEIYYGSDVNEDVLINQFIGALKTSNDTYLDPYTYLYEPESNETLYKCGIVSKNVFNYPVVNRIYADSNALNVLKVNDIILAEGYMDNGIIKYNYINDPNYYFSNLSEKKEKEENQIVYYKIARYENNKFNYLDVSVKVKEVKENSVYLKNTNLDDTLYVGISGFKANSTASDLKEIIENNKGYSNLIIDLKDNGGGDLKTVLDCLDLFIPNKSLLTTLVYKNNIEKKYYTTNSTKYNFDNIFIYMNKNSASASEIFISAMSYYLDNVTLVGKKSYGKGIAQSNQAMFNGKYMLKYTTAKWLRPDNSWIGMNGSLYTSDYQLGFDPSAGYEINKSENLTTYESYLTSLNYDEGLYYKLDTVSTNNASFIKMYNAIYKTNYRIDGYFDSDCLNAINDYQRSKGLEVSEYLKEEDYLYLVLDYLDEYSSYESSFENKIKDKING